jgi:hypothetical protein
MAPKSRLARLATITAIGITAYVGSYLLLRGTHVETWERDSHAYVIVPTTSVYYLYRPIMYVDGSVTGMRFHIGPHRH